MAQPLVQRKNPFAQPDPGRPGIGATEEHVLARRRAQLGRRLDCHRPLQGVGDVGLPAAVGADHDGDPVVEPELDVL